MNALHAVALSRSQAPSFRTSCLFQPGDRPSVRGYMSCYRGAMAKVSSKKVTWVKESFKEAVKDLIRGSHASCHARELARVIRLGFGVNRQSPS